MNADAAVSLAIRLAERLPEDELRVLAASASAGRSGLASGRQRATSGPVRAAYDDVASLLAGGCPGDLAAGCLLGAASATSRERARQRVEVVWTGPDSAVRTGRLTSAAVVDLVEGAREEVLLASYATHTEPSVAAALRTAAKRGVRVTLLLERAEDNADYRASGPAFPGLRARRLSWPAARRSKGASMHAKVIVVDRRRALVGSANVTDFAMTRNLECGVFIDGGAAPAAIHEHIVSLLERGEFVVAPPA